MKVYLGPYNEGEAKRKVDIEVHDYDVWDLPVTFAQLILPLLKKFKENHTHFIGFVDPIDFPEIPVVEGESVYSVERWYALLNELIWTFETIPDVDIYVSSEESNRVKNGLRLFGKYYFDLWD